MDGVGSLEVASTASITSFSLQSSLFGHVMPISYRALAARLSTFKLKENDHHTLS